MTPDNEYTHYLWAPLWQGARKSLICAADARHIYNNQVLDGSARPFNGYSFRDGYEIRTMNGSVVEVRPVNHKIVSQRA